MTTSLKLRRGTTAQHASFTGAEGEVTVDTTKDTVVVHDGSTAGGFPLAKEATVTSGLAAKADTTYVDGRLNTTFAFKNRIINGDMRIDQRNAGASVTPASGNYTLDRFNAQLTQTGKFSVQQNAAAVTPPPGFSKYLGITSLSSYSITSGDYFRLDHWIEGNNVVDLAFGTASAKTITISAWVRSSLTGTFGGVVANNAFNRCYPFTYTISAANTWTQIAVTVPGDTSGTWLTDNGIGLRLVFNLGSGSSFSGTAGAWSGSTLTAPTGAVSVVGTNAATWYITGVQLEVGSSSTPFDTRAYGTELALCQRYYWRSTTGTFNSVGSGVAISATSAHCYIKHPVSMRASPTFSYTGAVSIDASPGRDITAISATYSGLDSSRVDFTTSSGLSTNQGLILYVNSGAGDSFQSSAEL